jgi:hypothetical protein
VPYLKKNIDHYLTVPEIMVSTLDGLAPLLGASVVARGHAMKLSLSHSIETAMLKSEKLLYF